MFREESIKLAREKSIEEYLRSKGYIIKPEGKQYRVAMQNGLIIKNNLWYSHSLGKGGNTLDYLVNIEGIDFKDAVKILTGKDCYEDQSLTTVELPQRNINNSRVFAYLHYTRKVSKALISQLLNKGYFFEAAKTHNCVFLGFDENNIVRYAMQRSTLSSSKVKFETKGSNKRFSFSLKGSTKRLYVFEGIIDLLSYVSIYDHKVGYHNYLSLAGTSDIALEWFVSKYSIDEIIFCLDNDIVGKNATMKYWKKYSKNQFIINEVPEFKDWNEDLIKS